MLIDCEAMSGAATAMTDVRVNGPSAGFWQDIAEVVVAQTNNLTEIEALEAALMTAYHLP